MRLLNYLVGAWSEAQEGLAGAHVGEPKARVMRYPVG